MELLIGLFLGALVAFLAWRAKALTLSGALAAALTGGLVFGLGGLPWAGLLLVFFITSSGLSKAFSGRKVALSEKFSKGSQRDWAQVTANGGLGAGLVIVHSILPDSIWPWILFTGAMAAVNADTWATELGVLSRSQPRLIITGQPVERGASGGVSLPGSLAALCAAALVGICAAFFSPELSPVGLVAAASLAGLGGSFFDSFLGATVQAIYYCPACQKETERYPLHTCGCQTTPRRGWRWLDNDVVNFASSVVGAVLAAGLWALWF